MQSILIIDDSPINIRAIGDILSSDYKIKAATSGQKALEILKQNNQPDLILLDIVMPDMDGYQVLSIIKKTNELKSIPVIFVTSKDDTTNEEKGFDLGAIDYITKPVSPAILKARVKTHLQLHEAKLILSKQNDSLKEEVTERVAESNFMRDITMKALSSLAKTRDNETGNHLIRTQKYIEILAQNLIKRNIYTDELNQESIEYIVKAAPLHDIGKVGIPDMILLKPAKLNDNEFNIMKTHAELGADAIRSCISDLGNNYSMKFLETAIDISQSHHEKWDGTGYPDKLFGVDIPLPARLMSIADVFDALISRRVYKEPYEFEKSVSMIIEMSGSYFDPQIVESFKLVIEDFRNVAIKYKE